MPAAPQASDQLLPPSQTVYEFTGGAAGDDGPGGSRHTFIGGANFDLADGVEHRESNLRSGGLTWVFILIAVVVGGGLLGFMYMRGPSEASADDKVADEPAVAGGEAEDEDADKTEEPAAADDEAAKEEGAEAGEEEGAKEEPASEDDAKKDEPAPEDPKAEPKEEPKAEPKAEPKEEPKADPKPSSKKTGGGGTSKKKPRSKKRKTLKPQRPPRDPLKNLPAPP